MRRGMSRRPPFENRWTSGKRAWHWHQELEALGVDAVRLRLALRDAANPVEFPDPDIPAGFVRDWLDYHDHRLKASAMGWRIAFAAAIGLAMTVALVGAWAAYMH